MATAVSSGDDLTDFQSQPPSEPRLVGQWHWTVGSGCCAAVGCGCWPRCSSLLGCHFAADIYLYLFYFYIYTGVHVCLSVYPSVALFVCSVNFCLPSSSGNCSGVLASSLSFERWLWGVTSAMHFLAELK